MKGPYSGEYPYLDQVTRNADGSVLWIRIGTAPTITRTYHKVGAVWQAWWESCYGNGYGLSPEPIADDDLQGELDTIAAQN